MKPEQASILVAALVLGLAMAAHDGWIQSLTGWIQKPPAITPGSTIQNSQGAAPAGSDQGYNERQATR